MKKEELSEAARKIKELYQEAKVLVFGSYARSEMKDDSDIDLCVIVNEPGERTIEISRKVRLAIHPILHKLLDILVYDKAQFDDRAALPITMEAEIAREGIEL